MCRVKVRSSNYIPLFRASWSPRGCPSTRGSADDTESLVTFVMNESGIFQMKVEVIEVCHFSPEIIFTVITDIPHHVDWVDEPVELVSLSDGSAKLGTKWEQNADRSGRKLVTLNMCNIFEKNKKFFWGYLKSLFRLRSHFCWGPIKIQPNSHGSLNRKKQESFRWLNRCWSNRQM